MKTFGIKNQSAFIRAMALNGYVLKLDLPELLRDKRQRIARAGLRSCAVDVPCDLAAPAGVAYLLAVRE